MKKIYLFVLLVAMAVALNTSCTEQTDFPRIEDASSTAKLDVKQAKEVFVRDYTAAVEARSETTRAQGHIYYTLADTDYTPLWDKATTAENEHVLSIDVPLYSVSGAFASDTDGENMRMATQKLVFTKSKKDNNVYSYLLTLCPDVACAEKYSDLNDVFTHLGDCSKFSGLAIYTSLAGELVAVGKYVNGTETGYVYVGNPEADQHALHHQAEHLMEYMKFYLSSGPVEMTRGGGEGETIYEDLCGICLKNPCECMHYCDVCGRFSSESDPCNCDLEDAFCPNCHQWIPWKGAPCLCDYELICPDCNKSVCICNLCKICKTPGCSGCDEDVDGGDDEICDHCNKKCNQTCEAYCPECQQLKSQCDLHYCKTCGNAYANCTCS